MKTLANTGWLLSNATTFSLVTVTTTSLAPNNASIGNATTTMATADQAAELDPIPYTSKVVLIILYTLTTFAAVVGNSLAIVVFARGHRSKTDLRFFLINLAVADLIMGIFCIPFTFAYQITGQWMFSEPMCHIVQCCQVVSVTASVSTNTCIGIDRLVAVKFPLRKRVTNSKSKAVIVSVWIFAWSVGITPLIMGRTKVVNGKVQCEEQWPDHTSQLAYSFIIMLITYFVPVTILTITYSMIGHQLWNRSIPGLADDHRDAHQLKSKKKVVKMLATIVLLFGVCWLPLHLFFVVITFNETAFGDAANEIYFAFHWLSMANSFVNPVIYGFMNNNFRADLRYLLGQCCFCCPMTQARLKYRTGAMRWRIGNENTTPAANHYAQPARLTTRTLNRREMELKAAKPMIWKNGHSMSSPTFDLGGVERSRPVSGSTNSSNLPSSETKNRYGNGELRTQQNEEGKEKRKRRSDHEDYLSKVSMLRHQ